MKRSKKVKKPVPNVPIEESTDGSDTEEIPSPEAMKKGKAVTRKTRNTKPVESSDCEGKSKPKVPVKNVKEKQKKLVESSDCIQVAGISNNSDSEEIPPILQKRKVRVKKANVPVPEDNSDTTVTSLLPEKVSEVKMKRITRGTLSTTEPSDNSDLEVKPQKPKKKEKKLVKKKQTTSNDSGLEEGKPQTINKKGTKKEVIKKVEPTSNDSDSVKKPQIIKKKGIKKEVIKKEETIANDSDSEEKPLSIKKKRIKKEVIKKEEPISNDSDSEEEILLTIKKKEKKDVKKRGTSPNDSDESEQDVETITHINDLEKLMRVDPEFYKFLQEHDSKLLKFKEEFLERGSFEHDDYEDDVMEEEQENQVHVPGDLHGDSDESDFEPENYSIKDGNVTLKMVNDLQNDLQKSKINLGFISKAVKLFNAAVLRVTSVNGVTEGEYHVAGSSVFNAVLNMCVLYLPGAIGKYLGCETSGKDPKSCKHFVKIKTTLIQYFTGLLSLVNTITSVNIQTVMLKHLHQLCPYVVCFLRVAKLSMKTLLPLWSTQEETVRVLAFVCILRITRSHQSILLIPVIKAMFMNYMRNCKFVSPTTWPGINFMRRSFVEMLMLDLNKTYAHVFLYVRQLGIHLRNAVVIPNMENKRAVFNWQYLNSLHLFAELVSQNLKHSGMKSLHFPLIMIISNAIKLGPTPEYYPLRFYLIEMLMKMENASGEFITIMPFFLDVINKFEINKKHKKASLKPLDFSCIIRLSKSQMSESGFKDAVVDRLYASVLEYAASLAYRMIFPDCCMVLILFFRELVDKCNNSNHKKKLKQLLDKLVENSDFMNKKRLTFDGHLADLRTIVAWEKQIKAQGTPLLTYYENWKKLNKIQKRKAITKNDELAGWLPDIKRRKLTGEEEPDSKEPGPVNLFPSDSEDDNFFEGVGKDEKMTVKKEVTKPTKVKKEKKTIKKEVTTKKKTPKKVSKASNSDELEMADTGDVVSEFSW